MKTHSKRMAVALLAVACAEVLLGTMPVQVASASPSPQASIETTPPASGEATTTPPEASPTVPPKPRTVRVGASVRKRSITLVRFGSGKRRILIVGGIHGDEAGIPVARSFVAYLRAHPSAIPSGTEIDVLACANPDGYAKRTRGNARSVDLNRNFPSRTWRKLRWGRLTSGSRPASEPETRALTKLLGRRYTRVVSLHSTGGLVDGSGAPGRALARTIAKAAGIRYGGLPGPSHYPGSMGTYVPEKYPRCAYAVWELNSRTMTRRVRAGLLAAVK